MLIGRKGEALLLRTECEDRVRRMRMEEATDLVLDVCEPGLPGLRRRDHPVLPRPLRSGCVRLLLATKRIININATLFTRL